MNPFSLIPGLEFLPGINLLSGLSNGLEQDDSLNAPLFQLAGGFDGVDKSMRVSDFIAQKCEASVRRRIDTPMFDLSLREVLDLAKKGDPMAVRCKKILGQERFWK